MVHPTSQMRSELCVVQVGARALMFKASLALRRRDCDCRTILMLSVPCHLSPPTAVFALRLLVSG